MWSSLRQKPKKSKGKGKVAKAATAAKASVKKATKSAKKAKKAAPKEDEEEQEEQEMQAQLFEGISIQAAAGGMFGCIVGFGVIFTALRLRRGLSTSCEEPLLNRVIQV